MGHTLACQCRALPPNLPCQRPAQHAWFYPPAGQLRHRDKGEQRLPVALHARRLQVLVQVIIVCIGICILVCVAASLSLLYVCVQLLLRPLLPPAAVLLLPPPLCQQGSVQPASHEGLKVRCRCAPPLCARCFGAVDRAPEQALWQVGLHRHCHALAAVQEGGKGVPVADLN